MMKPYRLLALIPLLMSLSVSASLLVPLDLQRLTSIAQLVLHGRVLSQEVVLDEASKQVVTITTFEVIENIKGTTEATHSIKQIGGRLPDSNITHTVIDVPRYRIGEEVIVFLPEPSRLGFSSPVGLSQGNFRLEQRDGQTIVRNRSVRASSVAENTSARPSHGFQSVDAFKQEIRSISGAE